MNILLMGLRGSGKSSIGPRVAAALGREFVELDALTAQALGVATAGEGLRAKGEAAFRAAEARALGEALAGSDRVIALGGGTPTAPGAADLIREQQRRNASKVIYLRAPADWLRARVAADHTDRPPLTGADPLTEIDAVLAIRDPLYLSLADEVVLVENLSIDDAAGRTLQRVAELLG